MMRGCSWEFLFGGVRRSISKSHTKSGPAKNKCNTEGTVEMQGMPLARTVYEGSTITSEKSSDQVQINLSFIRLSPNESTFQTTKSKTKLNPPKVKIFSGLGWAVQFVWAPTLDSSILEKTIVECPLIQLSDLKCLTRVTRGS